MKVYAFLVIACTLELSLALPTPQEESNCHLNTEICFSTDKGPVQEADSIKCLQKIVTEYIKCKKAARQTTGNRNDKWVKDAVDEMGSMKDPDHSFTLDLPLESSLPSDNSPLSKSNIEKHTLYCIIELYTCIKNNTVSSENFASDYEVSQEVYEPQSFIMPGSDKYDDFDENSDVSDADERYKYTGKCTEFGLVCVQPVIYE